jgi:hypothetical protein
MIVPLERPGRQDGDTAFSGIAIAMVRGGQELTDEPEAGLADSHWRS